MTKNYRVKRGIMNIAEIAPYFKELEGYEGPVRLHWSGDYSEAKLFSSLEAALEEVASIADKNGFSAEEVSGIAYIMSEEEYSAERDN